MSRPLSPGSKPRRRASRGAALLAACLLAVTAAAGLHPARVVHGPLSADGPVSVDARHARQGAHWEHSSLEIAVPCAACALNSRSKIATRAVSTRLPAPRFGGQITPTGRALPFGTPQRSFRGRAPPLS